MPECPAYSQVNRASAARRGVSESVGCADLRPRAESAATDRGFTSELETFFTGWEEAYEDCGEGDGWGAVGGCGLGRTGSGTDELLHAGLLLEPGGSDVQQHAVQRGGRRAAWGDVLGRRLHADLHPGNADERW